METAKPRNGATPGTAPSGSGATSILRIVGLLAAVMIAIHVAWEAVEAALKALDPAPDLTLFYLVRGIATAVIMSALTAWLIYRYRSRYEALLRKQSAEAHRMRLFFENIVQDAGEGIVTLDRDGVILSWNRAAETIYGYTASEMIGSKIDYLLPPDLRESGEASRLTELVAEKGAVRNFETRRVRRDGATISVRITRSALRNGGDKLIGSTAIVSDITGEKEMEARLIRAEKLAAIGQAAASIAHEVRNALAGISGTVQVLKGSAAWKELPEGFSEEFDLQVTRIAHIVNDLMSYARPGTLHTARTNLHTVLSRVVSNALPVAEAEGKTIEAAFSPEGVHAVVDAGRLEQAFTNLVTNALQAMERGGRLRITTEGKGDKVLIRFQDTGCGMSEETKAHAFEPFFTTKVRGTGLGLPIVRTILEAHNGAVDLRSEPGSGTTVTLTLPAETQPRIQEVVQMKRNVTGVRVAVAALVAVLGLTGGLLLADGFQYVGAAKCKACHMPEHKTWTESKHANAFNVLKPEDQGKAECLSCHSTGAGKTAAEGADMKGVQCEACHGPGSEYKSMKIMSKKAYADDPAGARKAALAAGLTLPDEKTCTSCHNEKSPTFKGFDFATAKEKIKHWD